MRTAGTDSALLREAWTHALDRVVGDSRHALERLLAETGAMRARTGLSERERGALDALADILRQRGLEPGGSA
ncbi:MAG: hypothetical protein K2X11_11120 [Acetobacteraceae bacterium]|nr:hypothetical protein [Acetobacteraceae bacterium]